MRPSQAVMDVLLDAHMGAATGSDGDGQREEEPPVPFSDCCPQTPPINKADVSRGGSM